MPQKKILVTGGAGFVGTNLIKLLINKTKYDIKYLLLFKNINLN